MKIDGKKIAKDIFNHLQKRVEKLKKSGITPGLAIILVGDNPASKSYVRQKEIKAKEIGIVPIIYHYQQHVSQKTISNCLNDLNHLSKIHGIIVQQPLPPHIDTKSITQTIDPEKDIDGFHKNSKYQMPIACAILKILEKIHSSTPGVEPRNFLDWLKSKKIVVIGKGETGGGPIIKMFKKINIEPKVIDSKTKTPEKFTKTADIVISAVGKPNILTAKMVKRGVILISVGLYRGEDKKLHGDYTEEKIKNIASFYTPTPGGVGPVNVVCLLENLIQAAIRQSKT